MDFADIKSWISDPNERFIIIEEGRPAFVILSFDAYRNLKDGKAHSIGHKDNRVKESQNIHEDINDELESERLRMQQDLMTKMAMQEVERDSAIHVARDPSEIRLEDLPL